MFDGLIFNALWVEPLARALLHSLWQGALIAVIYFTLHRLMARSRPAVRVWLGELCLSAALLLPVLSAWAASAPAAAPVAAGAVDASPLQRWSAAAESSEAAPWMAALVLVWLFGVSLLTLRAVLRWRHLRAVIGRAEPVSAAWQARLRRLAAEVGVRPAVLWLESAEIDGPLLVGWLKPVVLFPLGLSLRLPADQIELLLEHELAHVRRGDYLFNLIQLIVETLLFFHPAVHAIAARVRHDRELACDDRVAQRHANRTEYARALLAVAEQRLAPPQLALAAGGGELLERVRRIVGEEPGNQRQPVGAGRALALAGVAASLLLVGLQRQELPQAIALPVRGLLIESLRQVGVEPLQLAAPDLRVQLAVPALPPVDAAARSNPEAAIELRPISRTLPEARLELPAVAMPLSAPPPMLTTATIDALAEVSPTAALAPLQRAAPFYPSRARRMGTEGWVELSYRIAADGAVSEIQVENAQPDTVFDAAAIAALQQWRFPAAAAGEQRRQRFDFSLRGDAERAGRDTPFCDLPTGTRICRPGQ